MDTNEIVWTAEQAHLVQAAQVDVRYALAQLRLACGRQHRSVSDMVTRDYCDRALDALERVEEYLASAEPVETAEEADEMLCRCCGKPDENGHCDECYSR